MKYAAYTGNQHLSIRLTPFFDSRAEARQAALDQGHTTAWVAPCANWQEHQRWNRERVGNYASCPVQE